MPLSRRCLWFLIFSIQSFSLQAQLKEEIKKSLHTKPKYFLSLSSFNTFIDGNFASIDGVKTGLTFNKQIRFSTGIFQLANNGVVTPINIDEGSLHYTTNGQLELWFVNLSSEYIFYNDFPWQFSALPLDLAIGAAHYEYISRLQNRRVKGPPEFVILYQPGLTAQFNVLKWFGFGLSTGYRFTVLRSREQSRNLDGVNFSLDFRLSLDELYYELTSSK